MMLLIFVFVLVTGICMGYFAYKARRHTLATCKSLWSAGIILVGITVVSCVFIYYTGHVSGEYVTLTTPTEKATYYQVLVELVFLLLSAEFVCVAELLN